MDHLNLYPHTRLRLLIVVPAMWRLWPLLVRVASGMVMAGWSKREHSRISLRKHQIFFIASHWSVALWWYKGNIWSSWAWDTTNVFNQYHAYECVLFAGEGVRFCRCPSRVSPDQWINYHAIQKIKWWQRWYCVPNTPKNTLINRKRPQGYLLAVAAV